jgi:hypothetical protein
VDVKGFGTKRIYTLESVSDLASAPHDPVRLDT